MKQAAKRYGYWAAARFASNLGIDFESAYLGFFGRLPKK